jgi:thiol-disulfide isomerase/thioredoxin
MAVTPSTMQLPLGSSPPAFRLPDSQGRIVALDDFKQAPGLVVMFICNHCPFVKHIRVELARFAHEYKERGLGVVGINPNDAQAYPDDAPEAMASEVGTFGYVFPYLVDESQLHARPISSCSPATRDSSIAVSSMPAARATTSR